MLYHFLHPSTQPGVQPVEGSAQIPGLHPYHQGSLPAVFRMPDDGSRTDDKEREKQQGESPGVSKGDLPEGMPEMFRLVLNSDFSDYFHFFMTPQHDEIIFLRNGLRYDKGISAKTLYRTEIVKNSEIVDEFRHDTYEFCVHHFHSPSGIRFQVMV